MKLERPTRHLIERYRREFEIKNNAEEAAISELLKLFPNNKDYKGVLLKCIVINTLYSTQIRAITNAAKHIVELDIDARLEEVTRRWSIRSPGLLLKGMEQKKRSGETIRSRPNTVAFTIFLISHIWQHCG